MKTSFQSCSYELGAKDAKNITTGEKVGSKENVMANVAFGGCESDSDSDREIIEAEKSSPTLATQHRVIMKKGWGTPETF